MDLTGLGAVTNLVTTVIDRIFPDPEKQAEARLELLKLQQTGELEELHAEVQLATNQSNTNTEEAKSGNLFIAGWRPFIGWVCGSACAWNWVGISLAKTICAIAHYSIVLEPASLTEMLPVLLGMLGLGGLRTFEKINGINSGH
jgi:hypothetical protein